MKRLIFKGFLEEKKLNTENHIKRLHCLVIIEDKMTASQRIDILKDQEP